MFRNLIHVRYLVAVVALFASFALSIQYSERGFLLESAGQSALASAEAPEGTYDLQALTILNRVLLQLKDNYVEPERVAPRPMLVSALDEVQNNVTEVVMLFDRPRSEGPSSVEVHAGTATRTFDLGEVGSLWETSFKLREIFRFLQENLDPEEVDFQEIEYAAINGLLDTLDPHSVLLKPKVYEDMQASNRGSFGGLGIVISIRDGQLTIISPISNTPASRAGLRARDRIVQINDESTINMPLDEAVSRLRGEPGTDVSIEVMRENWTEPHKFTLTREIINIESVAHHALGDGIGYVEIRSFQGNSHDDLIAALADLREQMGSLDGLVLDLRNNPGGLLNQAVRISDTFLSGGTVVTTVGVGNTLREEHVANPGGETDYPIVILVNPGSASASEIVSGALKHNNRAIVLGERTFGKGTVQVLYEFQDGSALKLTIAHYITPHGFSIQGVGIEPDLRILPVSVTDERVDIYPSTRVVREGDLASSLTTERAGSGGEEPSAMIRYYREPEPEPDPDAIEDPDEFTIDFEIQLARDLLKAAEGLSERTAMLGAVTPVVDDTNDAQGALIQERLRNRNVDWRSGENVIQPVSLSVDTGARDNRVEAGESIDITVTMTNLGSRPLFQARAVTESDYGLFDDREFVFGHLAPGESRSWTSTFEVPIEDPTRTDRVLFNAFADTIDLDTQADALVRVSGHPRPHWGFSYVIDDSEGGNGDGLLQPGESIEFTMEVHNTGEGDAGETVIYIRNESESALLLTRGREEVDAIRSGSQHVSSFAFDVQERPEEGHIELAAEVYDTVYREFLSETLKIPVEPAAGDDEGPQVHVGSARVTSDEAPIRTGAAEYTPIVARAGAETVLSVDRQRGEWLHVGWEGGGGWVHASSVEFSAETPPPSGPVRAVTQFQAPFITVTGAPEETASDSFELRGTLSDDGMTRDYSIYVFGEVDENQFESTKINYQFVGAPRVEFSERVPLRPGMNRITILARDDDKIQANHNIFVYRYEDAARAEAGAEQ